MQNNQWLPAFFPKTLYGEVKTLACGALALLFYGVPVHICDFLRQLLDRIPDYVLWSRHHRAAGTAAKTTRAAAGAAFPGRHAFSDRVGGGRPDGEDLAQIAAFAAHAAEKLAGDALPLLEMDRSEIGPYYVPRKEDGSPAKFLKAKPLTRWERCSRCGACARACPMGSIDPATMEAVGLCIKCQACVRRCTVQAKYFEDADFLSHVAMLEQTFTRRAEHVILL